MSQTGQQIITIYILSNILRSKGNLAMKYGQLIRQPDKYFFSKIMQKMRQRLVPDLFSFFRKLFIT